MLDLVCRERNFTFLVYVCIPLLHCHHTKSDAFVVQYKTLFESGIKLKQISKVGCVFKKNGNYKLSMCFFLINTYMDGWTILHFCNIIGHTNHKLHGPWINNNSYAKSAFHRFVWNRHEYCSSICILWTLMSITLFNPK